MSKAAIEELLVNGVANEDFRAKYNSATTKEEFIKRAANDGFEFTEEELTAVLNEPGDTFES